MVSPHKLRSALECIDPNDARDTWIRVLMAAHLEDPDPDGEICQIVREWSAQSDKHDDDDREFDEQWKSLKEKPNVVTVATIFFLAKQNGWGYTLPPEDKSAQARLQRV